MFQDLLNEIAAVASLSFADATSALIEYVDNSSDFINIVSEIGTIPESLAHDSTEEKLFSKASDAVLARAFREIGLKSTVLSERADSADVFAESILHGYTFVADSKAFRLSRTAKNQKDFKVSALSVWRNDADYAVLCSPYFQYPRSHSQIYTQAIDQNVCLLSWEHLLLMLENAITENAQLSFADIWRFGEIYSYQVLAAYRNRCFLPEFTKFLSEKIGTDTTAFDQQLELQIESLKNRGELEKCYWENEINLIKSYTKERAIDELIDSLKINSKIQQIGKFVGRLRID